MGKPVFRILRLAVALILNLVYFISKITPRDKNIWVFGAWNGQKFLDNSKHIFLYVLNSDLPVNAVWITRSRLLALELKSQGYPAHYALAWRGIWIQLRAGVAIFSHSAEWDLCAPLLDSRVCRVQTWHGMPIKRIGYDDPRGVSRSRAATITKWFPYRDDAVHLITAAGPDDQNFYQTAFNVAPGAVKITGYARNDAIYRSIKEKRTHNIKCSNIIYMPTLRGSAGDDFSIFSDTEFDFDLFNNKCLDLDLKFFIRLHPVQRMRRQDISAISLCDNIFIIESESDIYESIGEFDILITDFSGIYFDFLISGKPVIMAPLDLEKYLKHDRDLYYDYETICVDTPCRTWSEVFDSIEKITQAPATPTDRYLDLRKRFHTYCDDKSAQRVVIEIMLMLKNLSPAKK